MNFKKAILYLLLSIFVLILIYNYVLPLMGNRYTGMGMHMNYNYYISSFYYYGNVIGFVILILVLAMVIITLLKIFTMVGPEKCNKCGYMIESNDWQICPRCGNPLNDGSVK
jgi:hypothetical protein